MQSVYQKKISICLNRCHAESLGNNDVSMLNNAPRPQVRNGKDDVKQKIPKGAAWIDFVTAIVKS